MKPRKLFKVCVYTVFVMACILDLAIGDQDGLEGRQFQSITRESVPDILGQISTQIRGNYERISTWQGEVEFTSDKTIKGDAAEKVFRNETTGQGKVPQSILRHASGTRKFIIDIKNESNYEYFFRPEPMQYIDLDAGIPLNALPGFSLPVHNTLIVTPQEYFECTPNGFRGTTIVNRQAIKKEVSDRRTTVSREGIFDPRHFVYLGGQLWDHLARCQKRFEKNYEEPMDLISLPSPRFEESRDGNDIVYHVLMPFRTEKTQYIFMSMYFASEAGFNLVKSEVLGPKHQKYSNTEIKYSTLDGIYIPYSIDYHIYDISDNSIAHEKKYIFKDQKLNQPIPIETFTYKNLGLKDGDEFIDNIAGKRFTHQGGKLIELAKEPAKKQPLITDSNEPNQLP